MTLKKSGMDEIFQIILADVDQASFMMHQHIVNGEVMHLIQPQHIGCKWTQENKIFRSSLWDNDGKIVSAGFPKFTNWGENPDNFPVPTSLDKTTIVEKCDGSLLIVSKYKGHYILRTRGTSDATKLDNGYELEIFKKEVLSKIEGTAFTYCFEDKNGNPSDETWDFSLLFEWVSPKQKIILNYGDQPDWFLVGAVDHFSYQLASQDLLDTMAKQLGWKRPTTYTFPTVEQLMADVDAWKGKEGVCVYSNNGQAIHKVKGAWYLALHRMKEEFGSIDRLIDVWFTWGCPDYQTTEERIVSQFDWELFTTIRGDISRICEAWKEVWKITDGFHNFINTNLLPMGDPKDKKVRGQMAGKVIAAYGITNRASFLFKLLDGKELGQDDTKKLLYQVLKK
jgi:hypothetical protein